jgi:hypothetical protein
MGPYYTIGQFYASNSYDIEKAVFTGDSDPQFSGKGWTDMTELGTIGKAMCDFPVVVTSIRGCISHG